jgi:molybdopterin-guanine dinucleotide biosynthesis protein A
MGAFKPLLSFHGRPLVSYAIDALAPLCDEVLVMAGSRAAEVSRVANGARVLADPGAGPVAALRLAAALARGEVLLVAPADAPRLRASTYGPLLDAGPNANYLVDGTADPMVGCYHRADVLAFDGRSLQTLPARRVVAGEMAAQLRDLDTPEDLAQQSALQSTSRST